MEFMILATWVAMGVLCAVIANWKNRNPIGWFFIGALFSLFGLVAILAAPKLEDPLPPTAEEIASAEPKIPLSDVALVFAGGILLMIAVATVAKAFGV